MHSFGREWGWQRRSPNPNKARRPFRPWHPLSRPFAQAIYGRLRSIAHYCEAIHGRPPELAAQVARVCMCIYMQWKKKKNIDSRIVEGKWSGQCRGMAALPLFLRRSIPSCARTWLCRYINPLFLIFLVSCGFEVIMVWYGWLGNVWIGGLIGLSVFVWSGW